MHNRPVEYLRSLYVAGEQSFRFHARAAPTLLSTCFGVQLAYLLGAISFFDDRALAGSIRQYQKKDGTFWDENAGFSEQGSHSREYVQWQMTFFSLIALDMLGARPDLPLQFLTPYKDGDRVERWLVTRKWDDFWYSSNEIMFFLYLAIYLRDRRGEDSSVWNARVHQVLDALDTRQDAVTGFWGNVVRKDPANGLFGAAHIYLFYEYEQRPIHHVDAIRKTTLALQNANGLFGHPFGGACEDYDAVEVLLRTSTADDPKIHRAVDTLRSVITGEATRSSDGGMPYRLVSPGIVPRLRRWIEKAQCGSGGYYSGLTGMWFDRYQPELWATYFRTLAIASADLFLEDNPHHVWSFYDLPGWGYGRR